MTQEQNIAAGEPIEAETTELMIAGGEQLPSVESMLGQSWGAVEELETSDVLIPKIFHQQGLSKFTHEGLAHSGDWCDSMTAEVLAKRTEPLEIIVWGLFKTMIISKLDTNQQPPRYVMEKIITITPENAKMAMLPFEEVKDGVTYRNNLYYNFYCLLPSKLKGLPYVLSMGSTKTKAAQTLATFLLDLDRQRKLGASKVFQLRSIEQQKGEGQSLKKWFGVEVKVGRDSTQMEMLQAFAWYQKSKNSKFIADPGAEEEREEHGEVVHTTTSGVQVVMEGQISDEDIPF